MSCFFRASSRFFVSSWSWPTCERTDSISLFKLASSSSGMPERTSTSLFGASSLAIFSTSCVVAAAERAPEQSLMMCSAIGKGAVWYMRMLLETSIDRRTWRQCGQTQCPVWSFTRHAGFACIWFFTCSTVFCIRSWAAIAFVSSSNVLSVPFPWSQP